MMQKHVRIRALALMAIAALAFAGCPGTGSPSPSGEKRILGFTVTVGGQEVRGDIDEPNNRITLTLPTGTDVTALAPVITLSDKATVSPASGAAQDFTNPVTYRVTAEDGTTRDYTVTAVVVLPLADTIEAAETALEGVAVSTDESDVPEGTAWVSAEVKAALDAALAEAEAMLADPDATEEEKEEASRALAEALAAFNGAKGTGTKEEPVTETDKTALNAAITAAETAKTGVVVDTAAGNVTAGTQWVTQKALDTLNAVIDAAKAVAAKTAPTQTEVDTAETALKAATTTFTKAKQAGTKPVTGTVDLTLTPPAAFTDLAETVVDKGPAVKIYRQGTEDTGLTVTVDTTGLESATYNWMVDNKSAGTGTSLTLDPWDYFPGTHYLSLEVTKDGAVWSQELTVLIDSGSKGD